MHRAPRRPRRRRARATGWLATAAVVLLGAVTTVGTTRAAAPASAATPILASSVVAGDSHTCTLTTAGGVKCWGNNSDGQLGDGTFNSRPIPTDVVGLTSGVTALAAGAWHTCALLTSGGVKCWGYDAVGQLGDGGTTSRAAPVNVSGLASSVTAISAGQLHTCALTTAGAVRCWGDNADGELGDGTTTNRSVPTAAVLAAKVTRLSAGGFHTCVRTAAGAAKCWGDNDFGELGNGSTTSSRVRVNVSGLGTGTRDVSAGGHDTCAVTAASAVKCWGYNHDGELGDGTGVDQHVPVVVSGLTTGVASVSAGLYHTCARTTTGAAVCWGDGDDGDLGNGAGTASFVPVAVTGLASGVIQIATGAYHTSAVLTTGELRCWGSNSSGQIGDGSNTNRATPVSVNLGATPANTVVSIGGALSFWEGDVGARTVEVPVTLRDPSNTKVTVAWSVYRDVKAGDTATSQVDFGGATGSLTFAPSATSLSPTVGYIPVTIYGDTAVEGNETFSVVLTSATGGATIGTNVTQATILDDDPQSGLHVTVDNVGMVEGNRVPYAGGTNSMRFHVHLSQPVPSGHANVVVGYTTSPLTASGCTTSSSACDFMPTPTPSYLTFTPGQSDKVVVVPVFADTRAEPNETFSFNLVSVSGGATITHRTGIGTIINDD